MILIMRLIEKIEIRYNFIMNLIENTRRDSLDGRLIVMDKTSGPEYYINKYDEGAKRYRLIYIKKNEVDVAKLHAYNEYLDKLSKIITLRKAQLLKLKKIISTLSRDEVDDLYENMNESRRVLFDPIVPTTTQIVESWNLDLSLQKSFSKDTPIILTNNGERVRSKSEKILADLFLKLNIPYKYEKPLKLKNGMVFYPDFTFINPITKERIFWEHFGMMDNPKYSNKALKKIDIYLEDGIDPTYNLITTFESSSKILNLTTVNLLIERYLYFYL